MRLLYCQIYFILFLSISTNAQEALTGLSDNPLAKEYYNNILTSKKSGNGDTLELPFIDDFSGSFVEPDPNKWIDNHAFINNVYGISPVTIGVATLDALDYDGSHYENASVFPFIADYLTSRAINLEYAPSDSIYLSFYYQPQGLGEMPDTQDSLCLDFFDPEELQWINVWSVPGSPLKAFERVMINIKDEKFLKKGFQFRFRNYASLPLADSQADRRSNVDHWNIDYVILDKGRTYTDTVHRDVAFIEPLTSILKDFYSIPWPHFQDAYHTQRKPFIDIVYLNYDTITRNISRSLQITDLYKHSVYNTVPTANDVNPGDTVRYNIPFDYPFNFSVMDSAEFLIKAFLSTDAFDYKTNDTLIFNQKFYDYYAYDDGTAEAGYGLRGEGSRNSSVAVKFNTYRPDTLRAIDIYFNKLPDSLNLNFYFNLNVWNNEKGIPGRIIYSQAEMRPVYTDSLNKFYRYELDSPIFVNDTFYIGWTQMTDKLINIGFDRNRITNNRNFYTLGGKWTLSGYPGSLMIRPVIRMNPIISSTDSKLFSKAIFVYPNPARDFIFIEFPGQMPFGDNYLRIYNFTGKLLISELLNERTQVDLNCLSNGIYLLILENATGRLKHTQKLIIQR